MNTKWHIVADSSCDLHELPVEAENIDFATIPFCIRIGENEYMDDESMNTERLLDENERNKEAAQTACPAPQAWLDFFSAPGPVLAFTISSALSGSYNSACAARDMILETQPDKQIAVIDTKATGPETVLLIRAACELISQGMDIHVIEEELRRRAKSTHIAFALSSYHNLIKAGRVSRLIGAIAGHLGIWGVGAGDDRGEIVMRGKARGIKGMIKLMTDEIRQNDLANGSLVICHCLNEEAARELKEKLQAAFSHIRIDILPTRGLDSFYAERHGIILAY
ncbi:MAG: DegV family protein [Clostridia bacterium]|nr:DegV family protein [Clostridia bacterium]